MSDTIQRYQARLTDILNVKKQRWKIIFRQHFYSEIQGTSRCCVAALWLPLTAVRFQTKKDIMINHPANSLIR